MKNIRAAQCLALALTLWSAILFFLLLSRAHHWSPDHFLIALWMTSPGLLGLVLLRPYQTKNIEAARPRIDEVAGSYIAGTGFTALCLALFYSWIRGTSDEAVSYGLALFCAPALAHIAWFLSWGYRRWRRQKI